MFLAKMLSLIQKAIFHPKMQTHPSALTGNPCFGESVGISIQASLFEDDRQLLGSVGGRSGQRAGRSNKQVGISNRISVSLP